MEWVLASKATEIYNKDELNQLKDLGLVIINDKFKPLWTEDYDILLSFGGRGGGKSEGACQRLVDECISSDYFKCYYGRKVFDTIRGSIFDTLVHNMEEMRVHNQFSFSRSDHSTMIFTHKETGNKFIPFGADKPDKLKSIKDPTHVLAEEFDQFGFKDFMEIYPTLRTERGMNRFIGLFNTKDVFPDHWIMKYFFPELYNGQDAAEFDVLDGVNVMKVFVNYTDNYFINQKEYYEKLKLSSGGSSLLLESIANGAWGVVENNAPWLYAFDSERHIKADLPFLPTFPVYVFMDINNDPLECSLWQVSPLHGGQHSFIHCIDEFSGNYKADELGRQIRNKYPNSILYLGGDRSGQNKDVWRNH